MNVIARPKKRTARRPPASEQLAGARHALGRWVTGMQLDTGRLDVAEQHDFVKLVRDATTETGGFDVDLLKRRRGRLERLIEKAAGVDAGTFERERERAELRKEAREIAREAMKPPRRPKLEEAGSVTLPRQWVTDFLERQVLWLDHLGLLVAMLAWFENASVPPRLSGAKFEEDGGELVLVVDSRRLSFGAVTEEDLPQWKRLLEHLIANNFFAMDRRGAEWRIKLGSRTLAARKARS